MKIGSLNYFENLSDAKGDPQSGRPTLGRRGTPVFMVHGKDRG